MVTLQLTARKQRRSESAFSLVEVSFAIAIIGVALVPMFGLLPIGLNTFHRSIGTSVGAQIAQRVIGEVQETDFATLSTIAGSATGFPVRNFDDEGNEVITSGTAKWIYAVKTVVQTPPKGIGQLQCNALMNVVVQVVADPAKKTLVSGTDGLVSPSAGLSIQTFSGIVSANK